MQVEFKEHAAAFTRQNEYGNPLERVSTGTMIMAHFAEYAR